VEPVWYLDPRFLGPFITALVALVVGSLNLRAQIKKDVTSIETMKTESDVKVGQLALEMTREIRAQLTEERMKREATEEALAKVEAECHENREKIDELVELLWVGRDYVLALLEQMGSNGVTPMPVPEFLKTEHLPPRKGG
jgi:hypothetical protein